MVTRKGNIRVSAVLKYLLGGRGPLSSTGCDHGALVNTRGDGGQPDLQMRFVPAAPPLADGVNAYAEFGKIKQRGEYWPGGWTLQLLGIRPKWAYLTYPWFKLAWAINIGLEACNDMYLQILKSCISSFVQTVLMKPFYRLVTCHCAQLRHNGPYLFFVPESLLLIYLLAVRIIIVANRQIWAGFGAWLLSLKALWLFLHCGANLQRIAQSKTLNTVLCKTATHHNKDEAFHTCRQAFYECPIILEIHPTHGFL